MSTIPLGIQLYTVRDLLADDFAGTMKALAELDTCWILKGGEDPVAYISKYAGQTPQLHLKDMDPSDQSVAEVGRGCLDVKEVYAAARQADVEWMIVEQDICKQGPLNAAKINIENLKQAKLA